jgi:shikimate dehydrogenase
MKLFGLIGHPLSHSFSKKYFTEKFERESIKNCQYELFDIEKIEALPLLLKQNPELIGLNVTIPYKQQVFKYLDDIDPIAKKIGAVNVIQVQNGNLKGFNSDYLGFKISLIEFLGTRLEQKIGALILGSGGASKAVVAALQDLEVNYKIVSRKISQDKNQLTYDELTQDVLQSYQLIINTTPLGMSPNKDTCPDLPYSLLTQNHYLFDLVYNPDYTLFMQKGANNGAKVINGMQMLVLQAEEAWKIWSYKNKEN